jgi:Protein kinase domain
VRTERSTETLARRYALEEELGRGGTGVTWRAIDTTLERTVTVKILRPSLADDRTFGERLAAEARAAAGIAGAGFTRLLDTGADRGVSFVVQEFVEGESARSLVGRTGPGSAERAAGTGVAVLEALATAHRAGVLHLDLKPENILLTGDDGVRITDLGVGPAVRCCRSQEEASRILSLATEPPELGDGSPPDERTDVFLAGALLYELLTGRPPKGETSPRRVRPDTPRALDAAVARSLSPDPAARFDGAASFADAIRGTGSDPAAEEASDPRPSSRWMRTWFVVPCLVVLAAAIVIGLGLRLGQLELGGPLGVRPKPEGSASAAGPVQAVLTLASVRAFDPYGDGSENDAGAPAAADGDPTTTWRSENYFDATLNNKPGIGLLFDLGAERTVTGFRLQTPHPGFRFGVAVGDDPTALAASAGAPFTAEALTRSRIDPSVGRYVLLWITSVVSVGDGDRAEVAEFQVVGDR